MINEFYKPNDLEEAVKLRQNNEKCAYISGGTEINSSGWRCGYNTDGVVNTLISTVQLPLRQIEKNDSCLSIGANITIQEIIEHNDTPALLKESASQFANRNIRNIATIGGNIASNKSCSNLIPALLVLDANVVVVNESEKKSVSLLEYISQQNHRDLIISIEIPVECYSRLFSTRKYSRTVNDISIISVAVTFKQNNNNFEKPLFAVGGVAPTVIRLTELEKKLDGVMIPERDVLENMIKTYLTPKSDIRGTADFKRHVAAALLSRSIYDAAGRND